jgi:hypothetical protein
MAEVIAVLLKNSGPLTGPLLFICSIVISWSYHTVQRSTSSRVNRIVLALVGEDILTMQKAKEYGLLGEKDDVYSVMQGVL